MCPEHAVTRWNDELRPGPAAGNGGPWDAPAPAIRVTCRAPPGTAGLPGVRGHCTGQPGVWCGSRDGEGGHGFLYAPPPPGRRPLGHAISGARAASPKFFHPSLSAHFATAPQRPRCVLGNNTDGRVAHPTRTVCGAETRCGGRISRDKEATQGGVAWRRSHLSTGGGVRTPAGVAVVWRQKSRKKHANRTLSSPTTHTMARAAGPRVGAIVFGVLALATLRYVAAV